MYYIILTREDNDTIKIAFFRPILSAKTANIHEAGSITKYGIDAIQDNWKIKNNIRKQLFQKSLIRIYKGIPRPKII